MEAKLSADLLKEHEQKLNVHHSTKSLTGPGSMSSIPKIALLKDKGSDKQSEHSSKLSSSMPRDRFARLKTKMRLHTIFGGALTRSKTGSEIGRGNIKVLENTYKTEPDKDAKFVTQRAEQIIKNVLTMYLKDKTYDDKKFPQLCKTLSDLIKERIKMTGVKRFKVVAYVMIMENKEQCITYASRCLWDTGFDNYATATFSGKDFTAIGSVYAVYYD